MTLTFLHIEDEYPEFDGLVSKLAGIVEDYCEEKFGSLTPVITTVIGKGDGTPASWIGYELRTSALNAKLFRYIFVKDSLIPDSVANLLSERKLVIIDVLRPSGQGGERLEASHLASLEAIRPHVTKLDEVVMFTAHQGNGLEEPDGGLPRKISKERPKELHDLMGKVVEEFLGK